jgi:hypothetical protein
MFVPEGDDAKEPESLEDGIVVIGDFFASDFLDVADTVGVGFGFLGAQFAEIGGLEPGKAGFELFADAAVALDGAGSVDGVVNGVEKSDDGKGKYSERDEDLDEGEGLRAARMGTNGRVSRPTRRSRTERCASRFQKE